MGTVYCKYSKRHYFAIATGYSFCKREADGLPKCRLGSSVLPTNSNQNNTSSFLHYLLCRITHREVNRPIRRRAEDLIPVSTRSSSSTSNNSLRAHRLDHHSHSHREALVGQCRRSVDNTHIRKDIQRHPEDRRTTGLRIHRHTR